MHVPLAGPEHMIGTSECQVQPHWQEGFGERVGGQGGIEWIAHEQVICTVSAHGAFYASTHDARKRMKRNQRGIGKWLVGRRQDRACRFGEQSIVCDQNLVSCAKRLRDKSCIFGLIERRIGETD